MVAHARSAGFKFPYLHDEGQLVAQAYGPRVTFDAFVLDRDRRLRYEGRVDDARVAANVTTRDLANALDDLLAGRGVRVARTQPFGCSLDITAGPTPRSRAVLPVLGLTIGAAWALALAAQLGGAAALLHHHALIEGGPPLAIAVGLFSLSWLVMVTAMMLPSSMGAIQTFGAVSAVRGRSPASVAGFVGAYLGVWLAFGLLCFAGDALIHRLVDTTPWLAQHPFVIEAALLGAAGSYQFVPFKRHFLDACRHATASADTDALGTRSGVTHAIDCVASSGPLMLVMFAAGAANLLWMAGLTALMVYETNGRHGKTVSRAAGALLIYLALFALANQGLPTWAAG
jgi:predicted metal-binding membrane protein